VSVATALILQRLLTLSPEARGDLSNEEKQALREKWYLKLAHNDKQKADYPKFLLNPPPPLDDNRRPEEHRISFIKKKMVKRLRTIEETAQDGAEEAEDEEME
jgi:hypothetical protein